MTMWEYDWGCFSWLMLAIIVNNQRKQSFSLNIYTKVGGNLGSNFKNFGCNFFSFWKFFSNFFAIQWAMFQHFTSTIGNLGHRWSPLPTLTKVICPSNKSLNLKASNKKPNKQYPKSSCLHFVYRLQLVRFRSEARGLLVRFRSFHFQDLINNSPYCLLWYSYDESSENLALAQLKYPDSFFFFSLLVSMILYWCYREKFYLNHSKELKGWSDTG